MSISIRVPKKYVKPEIVAVYDWVDVYDDYSRFFVGYRTVYSARIFKGSADMYEVYPSSKKGYFGTSVCRYPRREFMDYIKVLD